MRVPEGLKKVPTDHEMWSDLVDDKGRKRGGIFYKAAFYDERAHVVLAPRFTVDAVSGMIGYQLKDACRLVTRSEVWDERPNADDPSVWKLRDACREALVAWLDQAYPHWRSPTAYWD